MQGISYRWVIACISGLVFGAGCSGSVATGAGGARGDGAGGGSAIFDDEGHGPGSGPGEGGKSGSGTESTSLSVGSGAGKSGCAKVDFLFIIDNSVSMNDQQAALIASFPSFMDTIKASISAKSDYHILVADTDDWGKCDFNSADCVSKNACKEANAYICDTPFDTCDMTIGAGVVHPAGKGASNQLCSLASGQRYMDDQEPDLNAAFACIAQVGLAGHHQERPMDALVAAMAPDINDEGGCNAGFLRDDAILVVTFISDDPNYEDAGTPQDWYDAVSLAKGGNTDAVVVLGLTPAFEGCGPLKKPDKGKHWSEFISLWGDRGLEASVCNTDFSSFFASAVNIIDEACDEFEPPQ